MECELPDGSHSVSDVQDYFQYILKKHGENVDKRSVQIHVNKTENRVTFKIKNGYALELLTPELMELLGSSENRITKDKNGENVPHLEITEVVLVHCNIVNKILVFLKKHKTMNQKPTEPFRRTYQKKDTYL